MKYTLANLMVLGCFSVLASYAYGLAGRPTPVHTEVQRVTAEPDMSPVGGPVKLRWNSGYFRNDVKRLEALLQRSERERREHEAARVYAEVYGITHEDIDADIFGRAK
jgi:hypothetical protein